ncbi:hypothetical protein [Flavobacterium sp.]|uniref:hypothetical protein n=1 Tax=Flavobacterium sp. TaxID=239 RepID=UPI0022BB6AC7|nr:hypothetical protein [Flavobacterium sp.]MCZ8368179.1 hypothetical protein [Flavobacterium sp.]
MPNKFEEYLKNSRAWIFKNLTWILIVLSLLCFIISLNDIFSPRVNSILDKAGLGMLTSGIFTAILKSLQFTGIFKEEITKVMTSTSFIENRNDLPQLWKDISKSLYNRKFPKISDLLEDKILNTYLPTNSSFYYEDYNVSINIKEINDNFEIFYTQTCQYNVILDNESESAKLEIRSEISDDNDPNTRIVNELIYFKVNGEDIALVEDESTRDDPKKTLYKYELKNSKKFVIKSKYERRYPLKNENYKLFRMKYITHGMQVSVNFPSNVRVSFFNIGLVNGFTNSNEDFENHICRILNNDIILPHQGFGMSFEKIR